jgi:hypothetical protein
MPMPTTAPKVTLQSHAHARSLFELRHFVSGIVIVSGKTSLSGGSSIECLMPDSG